MDRTPPMHSGFKVEVAKAMRHVDKFKIDGQSRFEGGLGGLGGSPH